MYTLKLQVLLLAFAASLSNAYVLPRADEPADDSKTLCFSSTLSSLAGDCEAAIAKIEPPPPSDEPRACIMIYAPVWNVSHSGGCTIETYSKNGGAACLDLQKVKDAATRIVSKCGSSVSDDPKRVAGITEIEGLDGEGVRILEGRACDAPGSSGGVTTVIEDKD